MQSKFTEQDTENFYDAEDVLYRSFWDEEGSLHWGYFDETTGRDFYRREGDGLRESQRDNGEVRAVSSRMQRYWTWAVAHGKPPLPG